jgi:hypothetical protein
MQSELGKYKSSQISPPLLVRIRCLEDYHQPIGLLSVMLVPRGPTRE